MDTDCSCDMKGLFNDVSEDFEGGCHIKSNSDHVNSGSRLVKLKKCTGETKNSSVKPPSCNLNGFFNDVSEDCVGGCHIKSNSDHVNSGSRLVKLKKYTRTSKTKNTIMKLHSSCRVKVVKTAPEIEDYLSDNVRGLKLRNISKKRKKPEAKRGPFKTLRFPKESLNSEFSINPSTVRERLRNLSVLEDYNHNHEDDIFECIDTSTMHTNVLLNCSPSSSGSSSPVLSRRASPSPLPKLTRESTPLQLRRLLNYNKDEKVVSASGNRYNRNIFGTEQSICTFI